VRRKKSRKFKAQGSKLTLEKKEGEKIRRLGGKRAESSRLKAQS